MLRCTQAAKDLFSGRRSELVCWTQVLMGQFKLNEIEALALLVRCWPAGYPILGAVVLSGDGLAGAASSAPVYYIEPTCAECGHPITSADVDAGEPACADCRAIPF